MLVKYKYLLTQCIYWINVIKRYLLKNLGLIMTIRTNRCLQVLNLLWVKICDKYVYIHIY